MAKSIPAYLKLHDENGAGEAAAGDDSAVTAEFRRAFEAATGWPLRLPSDEADCELPKVADSMCSAPVDPGVGISPGHIRVGFKFARLLESVLKAGVEACECDAAALYILDDATTSLKLRASVGLPAERLLQPPRPLKGAIADLEALLGHAVALERASAFGPWRVPEEFAAALCVPVSSPTIPLGTLWFFSDRPRDFTERQTNLAEIIAGRLAAELERTLLLAEVREQART